MKRMTLLAVAVLAVALIVPWGAQASTGDVECATGVAGAENSYSFEMSAPVQNSLLDIRAHFTDPMVGAIDIKWLDSAGAEKGSWTCYATSLEGVELGDGHHGVSSLCLPGHFESSYQSGTQTLKIASSSGAATAKVSFSNIDDPLF